MLGRRRPTGPVELAAAQRRLAALGRQFERDQGESADAALEDHDEPTIVPDIPVGLTERHGRHLAGRPATRWSTVGRDWLAETRSYVALAVVVIAIAVTLSTWVVLRSVSRPATVALTTQEITPTSAATAISPAGPSSASPSSAAGAAPTAPAASTASPQGTVIVDVTGKVRKPGIVELPAGARVFEALKAAGGVRPGVRTVSLNLARVLVDGEQIVVGLHIPPVSATTTLSSGSPSAAAQTPINLNTATEPELETLPDVGPVTAAAILQYKSDHGPFTSVDQLLDVSGIGDATLADIRPYVYV